MLNKIYHAIFNRENFLALMLALNSDRFGDLHSRYVTDLDLPGLLAMTILQIAILTAVAIVIGQLPKGRQLAMLSISALAVFWLQPDEPFITLKYWLPFATLGITVLSWGLTSTPEVRSLRENWPAIAVLVAVIVMADLNRYFGLVSLYTTGTPIFQFPLAALACIVAAIFLLMRWPRLNCVSQMIALIGMILILIILNSLVSDVQSVGICQPSPRGRGAGENNGTVVVRLFLSSLPFDAHDP